MKILRHVLPCILVLLTTNTINAQCVIAAYPFDGDANDTSSNGYHARVHGAQLTSDRSGTPNSAYLFNGNGDYLDAGNLVDLSNTTELTISAWFYPVSTDNNFIRQSGVSMGDKLAGELMLRAGYPGNDCFQAAIAEGTYYSTSGASNSVKSSNYNFGQWYHLVASYQDNKVELWVDGVLQTNSASNLGGTTLSTVPSSSTLWIGKSLNPNKVKYFKGKIDDVLILNCAADSAMVHSLYNGQLNLGQLSPENDGIRVFPNPASQSIKIESTAVGQINGVSIYNNLGQIVLQQLPDNGFDLMEIDISNLAPAVYTLEINSSEGGLTQQIVKK